MIFGNNEQILYGNRFNGTKGNGYQPIKKEQTNEEWFCSLSTEEKAEVLNDLYWDFDYKARLYYNFEPTKESFGKWLKQPHKE